MSELTELLHVSDAEKQKILKHYGITDSEFEENVNTIWEWLMKTDLPKEDLNRNKITFALLNCKMSLERSKKCIEGYYRIRTLLSDFYDLMLPNTGVYNINKGFTKTAIVPKLTPDLCRITICKYSDPKGEITDGLLYHLIGIMATELRIKTGDFFLSNILIADLQDFGVKNLIKYTPSVFQRAIHIMVAVNCRLKNIHFVNGPDVIELMVTLAKKTLPSKFVNKVCSHRSPESLYEYIPKEYLPSNYKGDQPSIEELNDQWCEELESRGEDFQKLILHGKLSSDAVAARAEYEIPGVGWDGTFRKLAID